MQAVVDLLNHLHPELELTAEEFSGCMFKRLSRSSSIAVPGGGNHGNQYHIALPSISDGRLFPSVTNQRYLDGQTNYKRSTMIRIRIQLSHTNQHMLFERCRNNYGNLDFDHNPNVTVAVLDEWINHLNGDDLQAHTTISYRRARGAVGGPYDIIQLEMCDMATDHRDFIRLRRVLGPGDYIAFLRHRDDPMTYSVFGVPAGTGLGNIPDQPTVFGGWPDADYLPDGYTIPQSSLVRKPRHPQVPADEVRYTVRHDGATLLSALYRLPESIAVVADLAQPETNPDYNPRSIRSAVRRLWRRVRQRRGQPQFRNRLRQRYGDQCQISGCHVMRAVQAAHIQPYDGDETNNELNGILLRSDIHVLFDEHLIQLQIGEDDVVRVWVDDSLDGTEYECYRDNELILNDSDGPSHEAIQWRNGNLIREYEDAGISLEEE